MKNNKIIVCILFLIMLFINACANLDLSKVSNQDLERISQKAVVCNSPYIRFGITCCLDQNNNSICDNDESKVINTEINTTENKFNITQEKVVSHINNTYIIPQPQTSNAEQTTILTTQSSALDLSNYPYIFIKDGRFRGVIVVGDKASAEEVISASDIVSSLEFINPSTRIEVGAVKLASEVADIQLINSILVGNACTNKVISYILKSPSNCIGSYTAGEGRIDLYQNPNGMFSLVVSGYSTTDIRNAASVLSNYKNYNLKGISMVITKCNIGLCINNKNNEVIISPKPISGTLISGQTKTFTTNGKDYEVSASRIYLDYAELTINGMIIQLGTHNPARILPDGTQIKSVSIYPGSFKFKLFRSNGVTEGTIQSGDTLKTYTLNGADYEIQLINLDTTSVHIYVNGMDAIINNQNSVKKLADGTIIELVSIESPSIIFEISD